jgi:hypothetical protein
MKVGAPGLNRLSPSILSVMFLHGIAEIPFDCRRCEFQGRGLTVVRAIELLGIFTILSPLEHSVDQIIPGAVDAFL